MPVIINELQVTVEPPADQTAADQTPPPPTTPPPTWTPQDIRDIVRRQVERWSRLWAH